MRSVVHTINSAVTDGRTDVDDDVSPAWDSHRVSYPSKPRPLMRYVMLREVHRSLAYTVDKCSRIRRQLKIGAGENRSQLTRITVDRNFMSTTRQVGSNVWGDGKGAPLL